MLVQGTAMPADKPRLKQQQQQQQQAVCVDTRQYASMHLNTCKQAFIRTYQKNYFGVLHSNWPQLI